MADRLIAWLAACGYEVVAKTETHQTQPATLHCSEDTAPAELVHAC